MERLNFSYQDLKTTETVLIPFHKKFTVCLSSQVGCAMKCSFCYTGTMGLSRHLKSNEIVGQYIVALNYLADKLKQKPIAPNIVFMGQGEPLHNVDEVREAITIFMEPMGLGIGPRQMTLSTAGLAQAWKAWTFQRSILPCHSIHLSTEIRKGSFRSIIIIH